MNDARVLAVAVLINSATILIVALDVYRRRRR